MSMNVIFGYVILCNWLFGVIIEWVVIDEYNGVLYDVYFVWLLIIEINLIEI